MTQISTTASELHARSVARRNVTKTRSALKLKLLVFKLALPEPETVCLMTAQPGMTCSLVPS